MDYNQDHPAYVPINYPLIAELLDYCKSFNHIRKYKKGEVVLNQDTPGRFVYLISSGCVKSYDIDARGNERILALISKDTLLPATWIFREVLPRPHYFSQALTNVECYLAPHEKVIEYTSDKPDLLFELLDYQTRRYFNFFARVQNLLGSRLEERLEFVLFYIAHQVGQLNGSISEAPCILTHSNLASLVGASREATTLALHNLMNKRTVWKKQGRMYIDISKIDSSVFPQLFGYTFHKNM